MAENFKGQGNKAVSEKKWSIAENLYTLGLDCLQVWEKELHVQLLSNRSLARIHLNKFQEALEDAENALDIDSRYEKAYIRKAAALEAMKLKKATSEQESDCPVLNCFREGLNLLPNSLLIKEAMKVSFPFIKDDDGKKKKSCGPSKAQRESCEAIDIRGASGPHELRINGVYMPTEEISGGWPIYRKRIDDAYGEDIDEDDNMILEFQSGLNEWMIKHASAKGTHRSFIHCKSSPLVKPEECLNTWQGVEDKRVYYQHTLSIQTEKKRRELDTAHFKLLFDDCSSIEVRGASGRKASSINGVYEVTDSHSGGWPIYKKRQVSKHSRNHTNNTTTTNTMNTTTTSAVSTGNGLPPSLMGFADTIVDTASHSLLSTFDTAEQRIWLEFNPFLKAWQIKPSICLKTNRSWAYVVCSDYVGKKPEQCNGVWEVLEDNDFHSQENINIMTTASWAEEDQKSEICWKNAPVLNIRGATGVYASLINGTFEPGPTFDSGYRKRSDPGCVLEYNRKRQRWQMRAHTAPFAMVSETERLTPDQCVNPWSVYVNGGWDTLSSLSVMSALKRKQLDIEKYGDKLSQAIALDVRGAVGVNAFKINGVYEPTLEISGGWPVYQRKGSFDYWLEFNAERSNWQIKSAANRGMDSAFAYVDAHPPTFPELCKGPWWVFTGSKSAESSNGWEVQQSVSMLTIQQRLLEDMEHFELHKGSCVPVDIRGAGGPRSNGLNGVFVPTYEMHGGWPVYQKRDDSDWWLEYDACPQKWMVRPTPCRGTTRGRAYVLCDPHLRPEQAKGPWRMSDGKGGWAIEPNIYVRPETEAMEEDKLLFIARRNAAVTIDLRGVLRPMSYINGVYEPTNESCYGWPVYKKQSSDNQWLEYHLPSREWQIKPTSCKGTKKNWAYITSDPMHPEFCPDASWMVLVNGKHVKQDGVTLVSFQQRQRQDKTLAEQRLSSCLPIGIIGANGENEHLINGRYDPSPSKSSGGWPSYLRDGIDCRSLLEFNIYAMSWTITAILLKKKSRAKTSSQGTVAGEAGINDNGDVGDEDDIVTVTLPSEQNSAILDEYVIASPPSLVAFVEVVKFQRPEHACDNPWKVLNGDKFEPQGDVVVALQSTINELYSSAIGLGAGLDHVDDFRDDGDGDGEELDEALLPSPVFLSIDNATTNTSKDEKAKAKKKNNPKSGGQNDKSANSNEVTKSPSKAVFVTHTSLPSSTVLSDLSTAAAVAVAGKTDGSDLKSSGRNKEKKTKSKEESKSNFESAALNGSVTPTKEWIEVNAKKTKPTSKGINVKVSNGANVGMASGAVTSTVSKVQSHKNSTPIATTTGTTTTTQNSSTSLANAPASQTMSLNTASTPASKAWTTKSTATPGTTTAIAKNGGNESSLDSGKKVIAAHNNIVSPTTNSTYKDVIANAKQLKNTCNELMTPKTSSSSSSSFSKAKKSVQEIHAISSDSFPPLSSQSLQNIGFSKTMANEQPQDQQQQHATSEQDEYVSNPLDFGFPASSHLSHFWRSHGEHTPSLVHEEDDDLFEAIKSAQSTNLFYQDIDNANNANNNNNNRSTSSSFPSLVDPYLSLEDFSDDMYQTTGSNNNNNNNFNTSISGGGSNSSHLRNSNVEILSRQQQQHQQQQHSLEGTRTSSFQSFNDLDLDVYPSSSMNLHAAPFTPASHSNIDFSTATSSLLSSGVVPTVTVPLSPDQVHVNTVAMMGTPSIGAPSMNPFIPTSTFYSSMFHSDNDGLLKPADNSVDMNLSYPELQQQQQKQQQTFATLNGFPFLPPQNVSFHHQQQEQGLPPVLVKFSDIQVVGQADESSSLPLSSSRFVSGQLWGRGIVMRKFQFKGSSSSVGNKFRLEFLRELQVLVDVKHPNILPLQAFSFSPFALVYPSGNSSINNNSNIHGRVPLSEFFKDHSNWLNMSVARKFKVVADISSALLYLHDGLLAQSRFGVVHRNIHPGTILFDPQTGESLLNDFTLSCDLDCLLSDIFPMSGLLRYCSDHRQDDSWCVGAVGFVDPVYTQQRVFTPCSDLYSLGILLLQLLFGLPNSDQETNDRLLQSFLLVSQTLHNTTDPRVISENIRALEGMVSSDILAGSAVHAKWNETALFILSKAVLRCIVPMDLIERERSGFNVLAFSNMIGELIGTLNNTSNNYNNNT